MKLFLCSLPVLFLLFSGESLLAQSDPVPFYVEQFNLYGYKDPVSGQVLIPAQFTKAEPFHEGFALVDKHLAPEYFIDRNGNKLQTATYTKMYNFSDGLAMVYRSDSTGFIDRTGKEVIPLSPDVVDKYHYHNGLSREKLNWYFVFRDKNGRVKYPEFYTYKFYGYSDARDFSEGLAAVKADNGWGYIDIYGKMVIPDTLRAERAGDFHDGVAVVVVRNPKIHSYLINRKGQKISSNYRQFLDFRNELAAVQNLEEKWGVINSTGKEVIPCAYGEPFIYYDGLIRVSQNSKYLLFDHSGNQLTSAYDDIIRIFPYPVTDELNSEFWGYSNNAWLSTSPFVNDLAIVKQDEKLGLIHRNGQLITEIKYDHIIPTADSLLAVNVGGQKDVQSGQVSGGMWGYLDRKGKVITELKYEEITNFAEGTAVVRANGKYGYLDPSGKEIIPPKYDYAFHFIEGLACVNMGGIIDQNGFNGGKWGFINPQGKEILPLVYDYSAEFHEGLALMYKDSTLFFMDKTGQRVITLPYENAGIFREGMARVLKNGKYGLIDKTGKEIVPPKYDEMFDFSEGLAGVKLNNKAGYIDKSGTEVIPLSYLSVTNFTNGLAWVESDIFVYAINQKGEVLNSELK